MDDIASLEQVTFPSPASHVLKGENIVQEEVVLSYSVLGNDSRDKHTTKTAVIDPAALEAERITVKIKELVINGFISQESSVANFRNIQYARILARWHEAVPVNPTKEKGILDATQWGPRCPQPVDVLHDATRHLYPRMSTFDRQSEFECLNLNVCTPVDVLSSKGRGLPVLVWIHGGAWIYGDGGCESDGQYLVRRSIKLGEPVVVVGFNYRLGVLGFLSSKELREEARARGEVGYNNLGLHDQRIALQWVQKNIHFFGGDGSRLTVAGESAGACSILAHLRCQEPSFQNAFMMSPAMIIPAPLEEAQKAFDRLVAATGLSKAPVGLQLSALRNMSPSDIHEIVGGGVAIVAEDPEFFADWSGERYEEIATIPSWAKQIVVGLTKKETALFAQRWVVMSAEDMYNEWKSVYPDRAYAEEIFCAYNVNKASTKPQLHAGLVAYTGDLLFGKVVHSVATAHLRNSHASNPKVYLYSFDQPDVLSPKAEFKDNAYHSQDNAFLFYFPQVASASAPAEFRATADVYSAAALRLANGKEPWEDISIAKRFMMIHEEKSRMREDSEWCYKRWGHLVNTPERLDMFLLGKELLMMAIHYAMSLPVE
ncbi:alpha/beta-hydrolase [Lipomyces starkeyi]